LTNLFRYILLPEEVVPMPVSGDLYTFNDENISRSPTGIGVYALYEGKELSYIGKAEGQGGIRERLQAHKRGDAGPCTQVATAYRRELHHNPSAREIDLLEEYKRTYGKLPRCNERVG
jgi:hypothetical protein